MVIPESVGEEQALKDAMETVSRKFSPINGSWQELDADRIVYELGWADNAPNVRIIEMALEALDLKS